MSSQTDFVQPSRIAVWLVTLFARADEAESILGDLHEEFSDLTSKSGITLARRWYWRQTVKTIGHLISSGFRTAPWIITGAVVGGFLLRWFLSWLTDPALKRAIDAILYGYGAYEDPHAYLWWLSNMMLIQRLTVNTLIGGLVAAIAKGREMTATLMLALAGDVVAIHATLLAFAQTGDHGVLRPLLHTFAFSIAIVAAGAVVRTRRSIVTTPTSAA
jgi:hypothetical protein